MTALSILTILATIDAPTINRDENGEADNLLFIIIYTGVTAASVIKGLVLKVDTPRDCVEPKQAERPCRMHRLLLHEAMTIARCKVTVANGSGSSILCNLKSRPAPIAPVQAAMGPQSNESSSTLVA
eukprot:SAG11_NODE_21578_length_422_cov_1.597523_1_plen_126_part_01